MPTVSNGRTLSVTSGQTSDGVIVLAGGTLDVLFGGTVSNTLDSSEDLIYGRAVSTMVELLGGENVYSGGITTGTILLDDGRQNVEWRYRKRHDHLQRRRAECVKRYGDQHHH